MKRHAKAVGMLLLTAVVATCAQTGNPKPPKPPKAPPPPPRAEARRPAAKSPAPKNAEGTKAGAAQRLGAPGNPVERLMAMPPEKREQILEKLPPQQQIG